MRNQTLIDVLKKADYHAEMGENCCIPECHKEAVRLYVESWIRGPLQDAIGYLEGEITAYQLKEWVRYR